MTQPQHPYGVPSYAHTPVPAGGPRSRRAVPTSYIVGGVCAVVLLGLCCGAGLIAAIDAPQPTDAASDQRISDAADKSPVQPPASADDPTGTPAATGPAAGSDPTTPPGTARTTRAAPTDVRTRTVTETQTVPFTTRTVKDPDLAKGTRKVRTRGVAGVRTLTYEVVYVDGEATTRRLVEQKVTRRPVTEVVAVGTRSSAPASNCDPNYSGACVPVASDVDCAGGSGNGPKYVSGPVRVVGSDIYDLDRDGDGIACDA